MCAAWQMVKMSLQHRARQDSAHASVAATPIWLPTKYQYCREQHSLLGQLITPVAPPQVQAAADANDQQCHALPGNSGTQVALDAALAAAQQHPIAAAALLLIFWLT